MLGFNDNMNSSQITTENLLEIEPTYSLINYTFNQSFEEYDYEQFLSTVSDSPDASETSSMASWIQISWTAVFALMILIATGGNCIVIWIVIAHRRMRTVTNYFLVNLSTADLLLITLNCIFNFIYMIQRNWPFDAWYCNISNFIANATVAASVFTLTGISCERYLAIVHPLHPRMSKTSSLITITFIWISSMLLAFPCLLYSTTITHQYKGNKRTACILIWPDGKVVGSDFDFISTTLKELTIQCWPELELFCMHFCAGEMKYLYQITFLVVTYVIPVILMSLSYFVMGKELWGSRSIGEISQRHLDSIRSKRKVVKMFILIVLIFAICWLPYHGYFLYIYYDTNIIYSKYTQHVYLGFYWFAMSNAMVNPLIYYWMNARFRQYFKTAICGWQECIFSTNCRDPRSLLDLDRHSNSYTRSGINGTVKRKLNDQYQLEEFPLHRQATMTRVVQIADENSSPGSNEHATGRWMCTSLTKMRQNAVDL